MNSKLFQVLITRLEKKVFAGIAKCAYRIFFLHKLVEIIINNTVNLLFKAAISILVISNHNSFRVLSDKIASVHFI